MTIQLWCDPLFERTEPKPCRLAKIDLINMNGFYASGNHQRLILRDHKCEADARGRLIEMFQISVCNVKAVSRRPIRGSFYKVWRGFMTT